MTWNVSRSWVLAAAAVAASAAAGTARADDCATAARTVERSVSGLACGDLHRLDDTLRRCARSAAPATSALDGVRWQLGVALERCACMPAPDPDALNRQVAGVRTARALAVVAPTVAQARACAAPSPAVSSKLTAVQASLDQIKRAHTYCTSSGIDLASAGRAPAGSCYEARVRRAAVTYWTECPSGIAASDPLVGKLQAFEDQVCGPPPRAPSCDQSLSEAEALRRAGGGDPERELWNLVTSRLTAAASPRATRDDRDCAMRMLATAVPEAAVAERMDRSTVESLTEDPQLGSAFGRALRSSLKDDPGAAPLVELLDKGADPRQVVLMAETLPRDEQRRFFSVAGGLGRALESARAFSAFEQSARSLDVVIAPNAEGCRYTDFTNVLLAGLHKAAPARIEFVARDQLDAAVRRLAHDRIDSCGKNAPLVASGPGCGAVIAVRIEDRGLDRGGGAVDLQFVAPDGTGRAVTRQTSSIRIHEFQSGCGTASGETSSALRLVYDLQFAFATDPREAVEVERPVRTEVCGLRPLPPSGPRSVAHDGSGLRIAGPENAPRLAGPANGAREALRAWRSGVGAVDAPDATAQLRFSSEKYSDGAGNRGEKLSADLLLHGEPTASFATVVLSDEPSCRATLTERFDQAGRMIGNEVGSFLAFRPVDASRESSSRRRWLLPLGLAAGDAALAVGGVLMMNSAVQEENTAAMYGLDPAVPNNRLAWGRGLLVTAAVGAVGIAIYAALR